MRLKPIEPGMIIECSNEEEKRALYDELCRIGNMTDSADDSWGRFKGTRFAGTGYGNKYEIKNLSRETWDFTRGKPTVNFSDLVIPELTAEEVLQILGEIGNECDIENVCGNCPLDHKNNKASRDLCSLRKFKGNEKELIKICERWKADHEKKEPEVVKQETIRIFKIEDGIRKMVHEDPVPEVYHHDDLVKTVLINYCKDHTGTFEASIGFTYRCVTE